MRRIPRTLLTRLLLLCAMLVTLGLTTRRAQADAVICTYIEYDFVEIIETYDVLCGVSIKRSSCGGADRYEWECMNLQ